MERIPVRSVRTLPETRAGHRRCRADVASAVRLDPARRPGSRPEAILLRQGIRVSAVRGALRAALRHERIPRASRDSSRARRLVRLRVPPCADERDAGGGALRRFRHGVDRPGVFRLDHAGAFQFRARISGVFLLALQGGGQQGACAARNALAVRRSGRPGRISAPRHRHVFEGLERAPVPALVAWLLWRRRWWRAVAAGVVFAACAGGLFLANMAISGEWNFQGGTRSTFVWEFPFQKPTSTFEVGLPMGRDESLAGVIFDRRVFWTNLVHNLRYYFVGRYSGIVPYYFPAVFALIAFLSAPRRRPGVAVPRPGRGGRADAVLHHQSAVHVDRRRRLGRQPVLHGGVRHLPVPVAAIDADRDRGSALGARRALHRATGPESVRDVVPPGRRCEARSSPLAAGGAHDGERSADQHGRTGKGPRVVWRQPGAERSRVPDLLSRRQRVRPRDRQELLGEGGVQGRVPDQVCAGQPGDSVGRQATQAARADAQPGSAADSSYGPP